MKSPKFIIKRNASGNNWWVTYADGALAYHHPLDTREEARKMAHSLKIAQAIREAPFEVDQKNIVDGNLPPR